MPGYETPACRCGLGDETAEHLLLHCQLETERRQWQRGTRLRDLVSEPRNTAEHLLLHCQLETERRQWQRGTKLRDLVSEPRSTAATARWIIQSGSIDQFQLASKLLYGGVSSVEN